MHHALHRKLPLQELAAAAGLSVSRLCHLFKHYAGIGPGQYLKLLRLQRAKKLLETSLLSVKEIAGGLSYHDASRFIEDFRKAYGLPPLRYRVRRSQLRVVSIDVDGRAPGSQNN
jgi:AraC family transcriptional regulator